ncbi:MAG: TIGR03364 family FAD-dependent oxidoreductase [Rhodospirillales bacterium]|nr:MAG: TIGR03364 family FAD-dependent oxidoreductase [Rhodospirillales bacterium]
MSAAAGYAGVFDLAVVGAGIVGLGQALAAARRGKRVVVIDREAEVNAASVRNFGFITVTGQAAGETWRRARLSRDIWAEVAAQAGIAIAHQGLVVLARRPEAYAVLQAFAATEMGSACTLLGPAEAGRRFPDVTPKTLSGALFSPHELRVESRTAVPRLAAWLDETLGVRFLRRTLVKDIDLPRIATTSGVIEAEAAVVCPGDDFLSLYPDRLAGFDLTRCRLQMLRVAPPEAGWRLPAGVMSDLSLVRYPGYAALPEAAALLPRLQAEQAEHLAAGIHLIVVQDADGALVVGDSHHYAATPSPFSAEAVDDLILEECAAALGRRTGPVLERWSGTYAKAPDRDALIDRPAEGVRIVVVTSGTGASTAFALGEEVSAELFGAGVMAMGEG